MATTEPAAQDVLNFWFTEIEPEQWFTSDPDFDDLLQKRFGELHAKAVAGELDHWAQDAPGALALIILLDQMSRNLHRGSAQAFAQDERARALADGAMEAGHDRTTDASARAFFYLPLMHAEDLALQNRCVDLIRERLGQDSGNLPHAIWHRDVVAKFGRFPFRNKALGRENTAQEDAFLAGEKMPG